MSWIFANLGILKDRIELNYSCIAKDENSIFNKQ